MQRKATHVTNRSAATSGKPGVMAIRVRWKPQETASSPSLIPDPHPPARRMSGAFGSLQEPSVATTSGAAEPVLFFATSVAGGRQVAHTEQGSLRSGVLCIGTGHPCTHSGSPVCGKMASSGRDPLLPETTRRSQACGLVQHPLPCTVQGEILWPFSRGRQRLAKGPVKRRLWPHLPQSDCLAESASGSIPSPGDPRGRCM